MIERLANKLTTRNIYKALFYLYLLTFLVFSISEISTNFPIRSQAGQNLINFQGKIVNINNGTNLTPGSPSCVIAGPANDTCDFRVNIYDAEVGGNLLFQEVHSDIELGEYNGVFNLKINEFCDNWENPTNSGNCTGVPAVDGVDWTDGQAKYIEIQFDPDGSSSFSETFSRKLITSVPYAQYAERAGSVAGFSPDDFVQISPSGPQTTGNTSDPLIWLNENGSGSPDLIRLLVDGIDRFVLSNSGALTISDGLEIAGDFDLNDNQALNFRIENLAVAPICDITRAGRVYYDTTLEEAYVCNGSSWDKITNEDTTALYGELFTNTPNSQAIGGTWTQLASFTDVGLSNGTSPSTANNNIVIDEAGLYKVSTTLSFANGGLNVVLDTGIFVNGVLQDNLTTNDFVFNNERDSHTIVGLIQLEQGDEIDVRMQSAPASTQEIQQINLNVATLETGFALAAGAGDLDAAYAADGDKILGIDNPLGLRFDLQSSGDFEIASSGDVFFSFTPGQGIVYSPDNSADTFLIDGGNMRLGDTLSPNLPLNGNSLFVEGTLEVNSLASFGDNINLNNNELLNSRIENLPTPPGCNLSVRGKIYFNTTENEAFVCDGVNWLSLTSGNDDVISFDSYDASGGISFTATPITIGLDTIRTNHPNFSLNSGEIEIAEDGQYRMNYSCTTGVTTNNRNESRCSLELDSGVGFNEITGSGCRNYHRLNAQGRSSCSRDFILDLNAGDSVRLRAERVGGTGTLETIAGESGITFQLLTPISGGPPPAASALDLDDVYGNDADKVLGINDSQGLRFDLQSAGNFEIASSGDVFFSFTPGQGITYAPASGTDTFLIDGGNLRLGSSLTPNLPLNGDSLFVEGSLEVGQLAFFASGIDLNDQELFNARIENLAVAPTCNLLLSGRIYYNTTLSDAFICNGVSWVSLSGGGVTAYGELYSTGGVGELINTTWTQLTQFTTVGNNSGTTPSVAGNNITIDEPGLYKVEATISYRNTTATTIVDAAVFLNGVIQPNLRVNDFIFNNERDNLVLSGITPLSNGDVLDIRMQSSPAQNIIIGESNFNVVTIGSGNINVTAGDLDDVYTNDLDKVMDINDPLGLEFLSTSSGDISFNLTSTGNFRIAENSNNVLFVDSSTGNIGIGTNSPTQAFEIVRNTLQPDPESGILRIETDQNQTVFEVVQNDPGPTNRPIFRIRGDNSADKAFMTVRIGELFGTFTVDIDGTMAWGPGGTSPRDTFLFRPGANTLRTDGLFVVGDRLNIDAAGSAANPGLYFENDTNTGLFHPANNTIALSAGGNERLRITTNGLRFASDTSDPSSPENGDVWYRSDSGNLTLRTNDISQAIQTVQLAQLYEDTASPIEVAPSPIIWDSSASNSFIDPNFTQNLDSIRVINDGLYEIEYNISWERQGGDNDANIRCEVYISGSPLSPNIGVSHGKPLRISIL